MHKSAVASREQGSLVLDMCLGIEPDRGVRPSVDDLHVNARDRGAVVSAKGAGLHNLCVNARDRCPVIPSKGAGLHNLCVEACDAGACTRARGSFDDLDLLRRVPNSSTIETFCDLDLLACVVLRHGNS